jgi:hypothetical protein
MKSRSKKPNGNGHVSRLVKPKRDLDIDALVRATSHLTDAEIYHNTYLSRSTISKLRERRAGKKRTRYPTHMTMTGIAAAAGLIYKLTKE